MTDPTITPKCPRCGATATVAVAGGLCPACLLKQVALGTGADSLPNEPWIPPTIDELAADFPQFEIIELIGRGGMGAVYKARQKSLGRFVALKILPPRHAANPSFAERFSREAQALAELNHPHIVTVHDFGRAGEFYFLLMEFVDGVNLRQALTAGPFTPEQALAIVPPICEALQYAHEHGIVHRDIKPENLLLDQAGRVKIADFGIARILGAGLDPAAGAAAAEATGLTQESILGTPQYMAPEQSLRPTQVDQRADIYSLGVVLYELLTGELPVGKFALPSHKVLIDVRLDAIVLRALAQTPELRYQTIAEMRTQVETVVNESAPPRPSRPADSLEAHVINQGMSYVSTPEQLATFDGQFFLSRRKNQMLLDDRQLAFSRGGTTTVIPLGAILDLSLGRYPRIMNPAGIDFISVSYDEGGQTRRLFFSPYESLFGFPSSFNHFVREWFHAIRAAIVAATGRAPGNTPANQLGTPSSSLALCATLLVPLLLAGSLLFVSFSRFGLRRDIPQVAPARASQPRILTTQPARPLLDPRALIDGAWAPEINRDITTNDVDKDGFVFFDMETGKAFKPPFALNFRKQLPELVELTPELKQWIKDRDVDILFHLERKTWQFMNLEMQEGFVGQSTEWESIRSDAAVAVFTKRDADHLVSSYVPASSSGADYHSGFSHVKAFRTRSDNIGIYQTKGEEDTITSGVRIRYKLIVPADRRIPKSPEAGPALKIPGQDSDPAITE